MVTIRDIAKRAGVSVTAVSYALNNTGTISEETRQRILKVAEELNYHPNAFARNLKRRRSLIIGVFISGFAGLFYEDILDGIHGVILNTDYELIVCPSTPTACRVLTQRQVDGAIVFDIRIPTKTLLRLASERFPIVAMDRYVTAPFITPVLIDNAYGTRQVFHHFYEQGARRIAFVEGSRDAMDNAERKRTFLEEGKNHGLEIPCFQGDFTERSGYEAAQQIIHSGELPEAVFCANDQMAMGFLRAMREHRLRCPDDILLVGFDDIILARYIQPSLSTVRVARTLWGATAAQQLIHILTEGTPLELGRLPVELVVRESSCRNDVPLPSEAHQ